MSHPLVSILVPVYNVELYIERCVRSLFEQTYDNLEFVFVDDCTPDKSIEILERIIKDYPHRAHQVRIIRHEYNRGLAAARNTLVDNAKGEFVLHVDSDDWMEINAVELLEKKQKETEADIVTACAFSHYENRREPYFDGGWNMQKEELLERLLMHKCSVSLWRRLIKHSLYTDNKVQWHEGANFYEDFQTLPLLVYYSNSVAGINTYIYHYNCCHYRSYSHQFAHSLELQLQSLKCHQLTSDFFSLIEPHYKRICEQSTTRFIYRLMMMNYKTRNRVGYNIFAKMLRNANPEHLHYIRWNHPLVKLSECNYQMMCLIYPIRRLIKILQQHL